MKKRAFSCLMLSYDDIKPHVKKIQNKIDSEDIFESDGEGNRRFGLEKSTHVTLLYGIHEGIEWEDFKDILLPLDEYKTVFNKISLFENDKFDILKFDAKSEKLNEVNKKLRDKLEYTNAYDDIKYKAHLTIAYLKSGSGKKHTKDFSDKAIYLKPNKYIFLKTDGGKEEYVI